LTQKEFSVKLSPSQGKGVEVVARKSGCLGLALVLVAVFLFSTVTVGFSQQVQGGNSIQSQVSINKASLAELQNLKGVGPVIAKRIVDYRTEHGAFKTLDELVAIKGIGKAKYEKIKENLAL